MYVSKNTHLSSDYSQWGLFNEILLKISVLSIKPSPEKKNNFHSFWSLATTSKSSSFQLWTAAIDQLLSCHIFQLPQHLWLDQSMNITSYYTYCAIDCSPGNYVLQGRSVGNHLSRYSYSHIATTRLDMRAEKEELKRVRSSFISPVQCEGVPVQVRLPEHRSVELTDWRSR